MLVALYFLSFVTLSYIALLMGQRKGALFFPVYFYFYLAVFHTFIPFLLIVGEDIFFPIMRRQLLLPLLTNEHYFVALSLVWTAAVVFPLGWKLGSRAPLLVMRALPFKGHELPERQLAIITSYVILGLGTIGFFAYFNAFGGIFRALEVARAFRTGGFEITNPLAFMRPIGDFTKVASLLFVALWMAGRRNTQALVGLFSSTTLSLLMLFFQGGRLGLAIYICLIIIMFVSNGYLSLLRASIIVAIAAIILFFGYQIMFSVYSLFSATEFIAPDSADSLSPIEFGVVELSFPSLGLAVAMHAIANGIAELRFGIDVIYGIFSIVPSRFLNIGFEHAGTVHTAIANPGGGGTIPLDMMVYGIYAFDVLGPAIFAFIVAFVVQITLRYIRRVPWPNIRFALELYFLLLFARHLVYFNPASSINSIYFLVLSTIIVYVVSRRSLRKTPGLSRIVTR